MKPSTLVFVLACALVISVVFRRGELPSSRDSSQSEDEVSAQEPLERPRLIAPAESSRFDKPGEPPLSPAASELLAELTRAIEQEKDGKVLLKECREAGVRASDFLDLASDLKARDPDTNLWNLEIILEAAAEMDGQAMAAWYDQNASIDFVRKHNWIATDSLFTTVATGWMRSEPRKAIRWAAKHDHLPIRNTAESNLSHILGYWPRSDFAGQIEWIEEQARAGSGLVRQLDPAIRHWAREDPAAALGWMESFAENEISSWWVRQRGYEELARGWGEDRLDEAVEWLARRRQGDAGYDVARRVVAERLTKPNPIGAIDVAIDIGNEEMGDSLIIRAARVLYQSDPERVIDWLPESGLSEETQIAILEPES